MRVNLLVFVSIFIFGCAVGSPIKIQDGQPYATFSLKSSNDSVGTSIRRVDVLVFQDSKCKEFPSGNNVGFQLENSSDHYIEKMKIPVGNQLALTAVYGQAKGSLELSCNVTGIFSPLVGHDYIGILSVTKGGYQCDLEIFR